MSTFSDVGQLAVLLPRPTPLPNISLPAVRGGGPVKGHWLKGGLASLKAELSFGGDQGGVCFFRLHLFVHPEAKETRGLGFSADLLGSGICVKCLPGSGTLLLEPCGSVNSNFKGVVAYHFSSTDAAGSFFTMLQAASALYCPQTLQTCLAGGVDQRSEKQQQQQQQQHQQQKPLHQHDWKMLQEAEKDKLQRMIEAYITEPGFLEFIDRLEEVW
eukprot:CAMPEP_0202346922 /NCGR_PEP_ID=MMETSP1126-20121109/5504_1 /ASSEMBLY_ACC=CAM_ASM_000457 /TAXON_ID=3047 /ORGANISM="Dunaliella tertiolecta, Strain CCMP1320" /LENGTH=214 /DNA_ID=CAMNT_0048938397 /DNA_START=40 /DNA_END=681 /DNA_ORIENTATION=-